VLYLLLPLAYLLGSVPMAILVARVLGLPDPRTTGSRNPGATNVLRYGGKSAAALTLAGDMLKAVVPVGLARWLDADAAIVAGCGLLAFLGHLYPLFFGFRGGKGVATALGVWLVISPAVAGLLFATWIGVALIFRYSSLSALVAALAAPLYVWWLAPIDAYVLLSLLMTALLVWRHRSNIRKLIAGQESRIGARSRST
jgi:glycerol-3-phosphate acyltransferase PlsY